MFSTFSALNSSAAPNRCFLKAAISFASIKSSPSRSNFKSPVSFAICFFNIIKSRIFTLPSLLKSPACSDRTGSSLYLIATLLIKYVQLTASLFTDILILLVFLGSPIYESFDRVYFESPIGVLKTAVAFTVCHISESSVCAFKIRYSGAAKSERKPVSATTSDNSLPSQLYSM